MKIPLLVVGPPALRRVAPWPLLGAALLGGGSQASAAVRASTDLSVLSWPVQGPTAAQPDAPVTGRVVDEKGGGLPGVNVVVKGTNNGT
ncbi:hypothetical protein [Hymenobacter terrestris]|uniref:Carboxypeptidase regulatory-like domain-containing protein n=1 Tax=Hymenobacter terrestris TaxID=2748310 RepID=A0ABX2PZH8_9BACT|nr:hypothetical protein [Hymenobacter terrestris]NVO84066.1 hypothetical protein [Hymenobacter terrestris]